MRGVLDTTLCDKVCQRLATGRWFSPGTPVSSTNKTDRHDINEIVYKVALNTINQTKPNQPRLCFILSHFCILELQDTFYVFDKNGDGMITTEELGTVLFKLGQRPTLRELQALIRSVDADSKVTYLRN